MDMDDFNPGSFYAETVGDPDVVLRFTEAEFVHHSLQEDHLRSDFKLGPLNLSVKKVDFHSTN